MSAFERLAAFAHVIQLDDLELREMGPRDVHVRILAASAEHNVDHAALAVAQVGVLLQVFDDVLLAAVHPPARIEIRN